MKRSTLDRKRALHVNLIGPEAKARGDVIERFATTEAVIDAIICAYYLGSHRTPREFFEDVLCDESFSFGLRRGIFEKLLRREGLYEDVPLQAIRTLAKLRNLSAHYVRGPGERRNAASIAEEFMQTAGKVEKYLAMVVTKLGLTLPSGQLPTRQELAAKSNGDC